MTDQPGTELETVEPAEEAAPYFPITPGERQFRDGQEVGLPIEPVADNTVLEESDEGSEVLEIDTDNDAVFNGLLEEYYGPDSEVTREEDDGDVEESEEVEEADEEPAEPAITSPLSALDHDFGPLDHAIANECKAQALSEGLPEHAIDRMTEIYGNYVAHAQDQVATLDNNNAKSALAELDEAWGNQRANNIARIDSYLKDAARISHSLGQGLIAARLPDGSRLINNPEFAEMLLLLDGATRGEQRANGNVLDQLDADLAADAESFRRDEYGNTGLTKSEMAYRIRKAEADRTDRRMDRGADAEELELTKLMNSDINEFQQGNWRGMGVTPSQRALDLARARNR